MQNPAVLAVTVSGCNLPLIVKQWRDPGLQHSSLTLKMLLQASGLGFCRVLLAALCFLGQYFFWLGSLLPNRCHARTIFRSLAKLGLGWREKY